MKHFNYLKQALIPVLLVLAGALSANAQPLNGTYTVGTGGNYNDLGAAITALNNNGVNGPVVMNVLPGSWSGTTWQGQLNAITGASSTNTITFQAQNGPGTSTLTVSAGFSNNYIFRLNNANWVTIKDLTLNNNNSTYGVDVEFMGSASNNTVMNCTLTGDPNLSSSSSKSRVFANSATGSNNSVLNNTFPAGCSWAIYYNGNFSTRPTNWLVQGNTMNPYYGTIYAYYLNDFKFNNNTITKNSTGAYLGIYLNYCDSTLEVKNNNQTCASVTSTYYGIYRYYCSGKSNQPQLVQGNTIICNSNTSTGYPVYNSYNMRDSFVGNTFTHNSTSSGQTWMYDYQCDYSSFVNNNVTINSINGAVYLYRMYGRVNFSSCERPLVIGNNITVTASSSSIIYNYMSYYANQEKYNNNIVNLTTTSSIFTYHYYAKDYEIIGNTINAVSNGSGTVYGIYDYSTNTYPNGTIANNRMFTRSGGTVYGLMEYYHVGTMNIYNNAVTSINTGLGTSYPFYCFYIYEPGIYNIYNNTFHNASPTGGANYSAYIYTSLANGRADMKNNVFSRASTGSSSVPLVYYYSPAFISSDYNNFLPHLAILYSMV